MPSPDFKSIHKVNDWAARHPIDDSIEFNDDQLVTIGKETSTIIRRIFEKFLQIVSIWCYNPKQFYADRARSRLLAVNLTRLEQALVEEKRNNRVLTDDKIQKIMEGVKNKIAYLRAKNLVHDNRFMNVEANRELIDTACLKYKLINKLDQEQWMKDIGMTEDSIEASSYQILLLVDLIRKIGKGDSLNQWLRDNPSANPETLAESLIRYAGHVTFEMGTAFGDYYLERLNHSEDKTAVLSEIFENEQALAILYRDYQGLELADAYNAFVESRLEQNTAVDELVQHFSGLKEQIETVYERYRSLNRNECDVEAQFKAYLKRQPNLFEANGLEQVQFEFNLAQWNAAKASGKVKDAAIRQAIEEEVSGGRHHLETRGVKAHNLLADLHDSFLKDYVAHVEKLPVDDIIALLEPFRELNGLYKQFGLEKTFRKSFNAFVDRKQIKEMIKPARLYAFLASQAAHHEALKSINQIENTHFNEPHLNKVYINAVSAMIAAKAKAEQKPLSQVLQEVLGELQQTLNAGSNEERMELLCLLFVQELNNVAGNPGLFEIGYVKEYLVKGDLEHRMHRLMNWAMFAKDKNIDHFLDFIRDFDQPLFSHVLSYSSKEDRREIFNALGELYETYRSRYVAGEGGSLIEVLKPSLVIEEGLTASSVKALKKNLQAVQKLIECADKIARKQIYDADLIAAGMKAMLDKQHDLYAYADSLDNLILTSGNEKALYANLFALFVLRETGLDISRQEHKELVEIFARQFKHTSKVPNQLQKEYVAELAAAVGRWKRGGYENLDILHQLTSANNIKFDLEKMSEGKLETLRSIALPAIEANLRKQMVSGQTTKIRRSVSGEQLLRIAEERPGKLVTALLPAFIEPILVHGDAKKNQHKIQALRQRLAEIEGQLGSLDAVKELGVKIRENADLVRIIASLPPEEVSRLSVETLSSLISYTAAKADDKELPASGPLLDLASRVIMNKVVDYIADKFVLARRAHVNKYQIPEAVDFYNSFPDVRAVTNHWAYKLGNRVLPPLLTMIGGSGSFGEWMMRIPLHYFIRNNAPKSMSKQDQDTLISSLAPIIEALSLAGSSFLKGHDVDFYLQFLTKANDFMRKETDPTDEEIAVFYRDVWGFFNHLMVELKEYPEATEKLLLAISDLSLVQSSS